MPVSVLIYYCLYKSRHLQNIFLVLVSMVFYTWDKPKYVLLLIGSIIGNYFLGIWMEKSRKSPKKARFAVVTSVVLNLGLLFVFKYIPFALSNVNLILPQPVPIPNIPFPVGISFFTFQAISYIVDVKRGRIAAQRSFIDLALYISFFPRLLQGPIIRYQTMVDQLRNRKETFHDFSEGFCRFVIGLGKKVLLASLLGSLVNEAFGPGYSQLSVGMAWLGMFAGSFYVYFDFSGYSDMAIGLGRMFGFKMPENFNYPYIATSVADFWRRWHITMSAWFKDYVFLPLVIGNAFKRYPFTKKLMPVASKLVVAMFITWFCTGIWHGTSWNYIAWGMYYFVLMRLETHFPKFKSSTLNIAFGFIFTQLAVKFGQVLTRSCGFRAALEYYKNLFGLKGHPVFDDRFLYYLSQDKWVLLACIVASMPTVKFMLKYIKINENLQKVIYASWIILVFIFSTAYIIKNGYTPFLYGKY